MNYPSVILHPKREESALFGHPWIFSKAIAEAPKQHSLVHVYAADGKCIGTASYNPKQTIALRLFSRERVTLDALWFYEKLQLLQRYRKEFIKSHSYRLAFGESDGLPGFVIDIFDQKAIVQVNTQGALLALPAVQEALGRLGISEIFPIDSEQEEVLLKPPPDQLIWSEENGLSIALRLGSQKTGWFCDQRENRQKLALLRAPTVLNLFSFSGGFSLAALASGSKLVVNVDRDSKALELFSLMKEKNNLLGISENHTADCWEYLKKEERLFDLVIADPPAFVKHRDKKESALKGYKDIFAMSLRRVKKGGFLAVFSCSHYINQDDLAFTLRQAYQTTGRFFQTVETLLQPCDHPVPAYFPESRYLKGFLLKELV